METTARGWNVLDRERAILWREYSFGPGVATTFVLLEPKVAGAAGRGAAPPTK